MLEPFVATLPARLTDAVSTAELERATRPPDGAGVRRSSFGGSQWIDTRLVPSLVPNLMLALDPLADARELCTAWGVERPVAISPAVHQSSWSVLVAGPQLEDPHNQRIASSPFTAGRWQITPRLDGRPAGALPALVSGASPAYDVLERGGDVVAIEIRPTQHSARTLAADAADAESLLAAMRAAEPAWRGGWRVDPAATFVAVYDGGVPAAGAALTDDGDMACASELCVATRGGGFGLALLDALEALARERGLARVRLDSSAFLFGEELPYARYGYAAGPPYEGDADVEVWAEKTL